MPGSSYDVLSGIVVDGAAVQPGIITASCRVRDSIRSRTAARVG
jgi:hypothetical protein